MLTCPREIEEARGRKKKKVQPKDDSGRLWVDKYRPTSYMDLMGDQRINRDVLRWVKQWDYCVFKKSAQKESQRDKQLRHYKSTFGAEPKFAAFKKDVKETNDPLLRPEKKVRLLHDMLQDPPFSHGCNRSCSCQALLGLARPPWRMSLPSKQATTLSKSMLATTVQAR